jgi:hypothetical protein
MASKTITIACFGGALARLTVVYPFDTFWGIMLTVLSEHESLQLCTFFWVIESINTNENN